MNVGFRDILPIELQFGLLDYGDVADSDPSNVISLAVNNLKVKQLSVFWNEGAFKANNRVLCGSVEVFKYYVRKRGFIGQAHMDLMFSAPGCQKMLFSFQCLDEHREPKDLRNYIQQIVERFQTTDNAGDFAKNVMLYEDCFMSWGSADLKLEKVICFICLYIF